METNRQNISKTTFDEEQRRKDREFLDLLPAERLKILEVMRRRIWGEQYSSGDWSGQRVFKHRFE